MSIIECRKAIEQFLAFVENPDLHRAGVQAAIRHLGACPDCERKMKHFYRAWATDEEDKLTCQECQELLAEYVQAEAEEQSDAPEWRPLAWHLATCPHCSQEHAELADLLALAWGKAGVEPPDYPAPDLSFLRAERQAGKNHWRLDELGRLIIEFSAELLRALQPPTLQPAYATTKAQSPRTLCQFSLKTQDLEVAIAAEEQRGDPAHCTVSVEVNIPSRGGWPQLAGTEVTLRRDELQLQTQRTDAFGKALFEGIASDDLARLIFEITPHS
jgi:hypothetical protein